MIKTKKWIRYTLHWSRCTWWKRTHWLYRRSYGLWRV